MPECQEARATLGSGEQGTPGCQEVKGPSEGLTQRGNNRTLGCHQGSPTWLTAGLGTKLFPTMAFTFPIWKRMDCTRRDFFKLLFNKDTLRCWSGGHRLLACPPAVPLRKTLAVGGAHPGCPSTGQRMRLGAATNASSGHNRAAHQAPLRVLQGF